MELYRFMPLGDEKSKQRLESLLKNHEVYFSNVKEFNDPFDRPRITIDFSNEDTKLRVNTAVDSMLRKDERSLSPAKKYTERNRLRQQLKSKSFYNNYISRFMDNYCALCLSQENSDIAMWSHYANSHKGVCIGFDFAEIENNFQHFYHIKYKSERPEICMSDRVDPLRFLEAFSVKSPSWEYEKEVRVVNYHEAKLVSFDKKLINSIYFGSEISTSDKTYLKELIKLHMPHVDMYSTIRNEQSLKLYFSKTA